MSIFLHGIGLGGGITIGRAFLLDKSLDYVPCTNIEDDEVESEILRFEKALHDTRRELELLRGNIPSDAPAELGAFLSLSIMMLNDSQISQVPIDIINEEKCTVEWAIKLQSENLSNKFDTMEDKYLKERKHDVLQVLERIFKNLEGNNFDWENAGGLEHGILVTHDLSVADLVKFKESNFAGFITEVGSLTSHTAIVGRNLSLPALVGANMARMLIREDDLLILDGIKGVIIINPELSILSQYKKQQNRWIKQKARLSNIRNQETKTKDNIKIDLLANIDSVTDLEEVNYNNASGIGLFRSEFLFLSSTDHLVSEDEQFEVYSRLIKTMNGLPVTIRTADFGADKNPSWNLAQNEALNPALGLTGIRLSLVEQVFFRAQLRAILRASNYGEIQILFPMISSAFELKQAIHQLELVKAELIEENIGFNSKIKIGAMIEVPSAAFTIKSILAHVDFISIGTNDLIQYLLAIDRNDEAVNYLYNPLHPAVLKLLMHVIKNANKASIPVSVCGEMAGDLRLTRLLLGMGFRKLSIYSANILQVKQIVLNTNINDTLGVITKILRTENIERIEDLINELNYGLEI